MQDKIKEIKKYGLKAQGKKELCRHLNGERLTRSEAILAKCYECNGCYSDGKADCEIPACPLYSFMPYQKMNCDSN